MDGKGEAGEAAEGDEDDELVLPPEVDASCAAESGVAGLGVAGPGEDGEVSEAEAARLRQEFNKKMETVRKREKLLHFF